jgi:ABC-type glycerol-3-phosphate transport system permease component
MNAGPTPLRIRGNRITGTRILLNAVLLGVGLVMVLPLVWAVLTSFKPSADIVTETPTFLPRTWTLEHYLNLQEVAPFLGFFLNSVIVSSVSTIFVILGSTAAGYVFAKYKFRGRDFLLLLVISTLLIPMESYVIPMFLTINALHWVNSYQGIIYPTIIMSTGIFFLRQNIASIPDELIDAARIDGASEFTVLRKVIFPSLGPAIAAIAIVNWVYTWSLFLWPLIVASSTKLFTMEIGLMYFQRQYIVDYGGVFAATVITLLPVLTVFLIFRRNIIQGISTTGMK